MPCERKRRSRSASSSELVVTAPPSPVVIAFTGWNENVHMSERAQLPTGPSGVRAPSACAASSTTTRGRGRQRREVDRAGPRSAPRRARRTSADERRVEVQRRRGRCRRMPASRRRSGRSSPTRRTTAVTSRRGRPAPMPAAHNAPCSAAVPLANATAWLRLGDAAQRVLEARDGRPAGQPVAPQDVDDGGDVVVVDRLAAVRDMHVGARRRRRGGRR